ncbi:hypothetical protein GAY33_05410 [Azospirillum brasilense]|uniref:hypothetical protein n=1 Tax=Azospirillum argentinense TaxID=2970906 RepID=UPI00190D9838|nr:hypothetical protein [Azospirillum argentinense]MBK3798674.1 hypothetical protein [Azospirillum argentinense]
MICPPTAAQLLAARWRPSEEHPGVILAELGASHGHLGLVTIDAERGLDLPDATVAAVAAHLAALHNATRPGAATAERVVIVAEGPLREILVLG